ncbi:MAG TPA: hypothetical protein VF639_00450 [Hymenobacter sp.]
MSYEEVTESIRQGKLVIARDWLDDFTSIFPLFCLITLSIMMLLDAPPDSRQIAVSLVLFSGGLFLYGLYCLIQERNLTTVETYLSATENRQLVTHVFESSGWKIIHNNSQLVVATIPHKWYGFVGQTARAIIQNDSVLLNVMHHSSNRGRSAFSFGLNSRELSLLIDMLRKKPPSNIELTWTTPTTPS